MDIVKSKIEFIKPPLVPLMKTQKPKNDFKSLKPKNRN